MKMRDSNKIKPYETIFAIKDVLITSFQAVFFEKIFSKQASIKNVRIKQIKNKSIRKI
ncbi:MAG: hypothetical protein WCX74_00010 [Candidatus Paceibacterota bacterium]